VAQLGYQIVQLCRAHRALASEMLSKIGLHIGQEIILMHLWKQDGQNQTQLAQQMNVQAPTVTKMLQRLEQTGILERRTAKHDQRVTNVWLTQKGKDLEPKVNEIWAELEQRTIEHLSHEERTSFEVIIKKIVLGLRPVSPSESDC
jgi:MarR family transcriptional regulator, organic hydroperoxide resistance regulator